MQGTMPDARRRGRPRTAWMDNINTWTERPVKESIRMTEGRDKEIKYVHGVAKEQYRTRPKTHTAKSVFLACIPWNSCILVGQRYCET